jgi:hypothetical protein
MKPEKLSVGDVIICVVSVDSELENDEAASGHVCRIDFRIKSSSS